MPIDWSILVALVYRSFNQEGLDREYSPSSCVDDLMVYVNEYLRLSQEARQEAVMAGSAVLGLEYGPLASQRLDLFLPETTPAAVNLYIHGGYWQELSKDYACFSAPIFQRRACALAALGYSLAPQQRLTDIVEECRCALEWLYMNANGLGIDKDRIHLSGSSAGAHLAMMLYTTDWEKRGLPRDIIKGVCAVSGIYDLEPVRLSYVNSELYMDQQEARANSPMHLEPSALMPVIMAYGSNETNEFKRQSNEYRDKLENAGVPIEFREIGSRNHFDVIMDLADESSWLATSTLRQMSLSSKTVSTPVLGNPEVDEA
jgi:arylformamidase